MIASKQIHRTIVICIPDSTTFQNARPAVSPSSHTEASGSVCESRTLKWTFHWNMVGKVMVRKARVELPGANSHLRVVLVKRVIIGLFLLFCIIPVLAFAITSKIHSVKRERELLSQGHLIVAQIQIFRQMHDHTPINLNELGDLPFSPDRAWIYALTDDQHVVLSASIGWLKRDVVYREDPHNYPEVGWFLADEENEKFLPEK